MRTRPEADRPLSIPGTVRGVRLLVKDETRNESGSHKQRAANAVARAAAADGHDRVVVGSCGNYGLAVAVEARRAGLAATVVLPAGWGGLGARARELGAEVQFVAGGYEHAVYASKALAMAWRVADGNVDGPYAAQVARALAQIVHEIAEELPAWPEAAWVPLGNGTTTAAIGSALAGLGWSTRVVAVTALANNSILASWPHVRHTSLKPEEITASPVREPLVNWSALHGQEALDVLHAGQGTVVGVTDRQLAGARDLLGWYHVPASPAGAAGVAGLVAYGNRFAAGGTHVAVLTGQ